MISVTYIQPNHLNSIITAKHFCFYLGLILIEYTTMQATSLASMVHQQAGSLSFGCQGCNKVSMSVLALHTIQYSFIQLCLQVLFVIAVNISMMAEYLNIAFRSNRGFLKLSMDSLKLFNAESDRVTQSIEGWRSPVYLF